MSKELLTVILTATRSGETREALWSEFDLDKAIWVIPKQRMKSESPQRAALRTLLGYTRQARIHQPRWSLSLRGVPRSGRPFFRHDLHEASSAITGSIRERPPTDFALVSRTTAAVEVEKVADEVSEAALAHTIKDRVKAAPSENGLL